MMIFYEILITIISTGAIYLFVNTMQRPLKKPQKALLYLTFGISIFLLMEFGNLEKKREIYGQGVYRISFIEKIPMAFLLFLLLLLIVNEIILFIWLHHDTKNVLTPWSMKESLDYLLDGVCFARMDGTPLLVNEQMNKLSTKLFHCSITNVKLFWDLLTENLEEPKQILIKQIPGEGYWEFQFQVLQVDAFRVYEITACNITKACLLKQELEKRIQRLHRMNTRLLNFGKEIEAVTREQEILNAKIKVHHDVGRTLLASQVYLEQPVEERNRKELLALLNYVLSVMKHEAVGEQADDWKAFLRMADAMSVEVTLKGNLPEHKKIRGMFLTAFRECLTNTVKHAKGGHLMIHISEDDPFIIAKITNDGIAPDKEIKETGGLKNLRRMVDSMNGKMTITSIPKFCMEVVFDERGEESCQGNDRR